MKYFILTANDDCDLSNLVDEWLDQGWKPIGGVSVAIIPSGGTASLKGAPPNYTDLQYWQAVIHENDDPTYPGME